MASAKKKDSDPLKVYTLVMALLVVVIGVLYFVIDGRRKKYAAANLRAERAMTGKGLPMTISDKPRTLPELAIRVEQLADAYSEASGGSGLEGHISQEMMDVVATKVGLRQIYAGRERRTPGRGKRYETITQNFEYEGVTDPNPEVWRVLGLLYNIETRRPYRVSDLNWAVADQKNNPRPPFDRVTKPRITVALRRQTLDAP